jgi:hypothetical protein
MFARSLVLLLVVMNLGALAWWTLHAEARPAPVPTTQQNVPPLVLLSESEIARQAQTVASDELAAAPDPNAATPRCETIGPFATPADLRRAMNTLSPLVGHIQYRQANGSVMHGYRVFVPALASRDAALEAARQLSAKGISDYYVVTSGTQENTISLGLFHDMINAEKRRDEIRALGFDARLEPRLDDAQQYWIDAAVARDFDWSAHLAGYAGVASKDITCVETH